MRHGGAFLERYGFKATSYVITEAIGANEDFMTAEQLKALAGKGHEIGGHSATHPELRTLSDAELLAELSSSQDWIVSRTHTCLRPTATSPTALRTVDLARVVHRDPR